MIFDNLIYPTHKAIKRTIVVCWDYYVHIKYNYD